MDDPLRLALFDYTYPEDLVAQAPVEPRDHSRLLHVARDGSLDDRRFRDLPTLLQPGDLLVLNETKVLKARLRGFRVPSGGAVEALVLGPTAEDPEVIGVVAKPARRLKAGGRLRFGNFEAEVLGPNRIRFESGVDIRSVLETCGELPLPPYISPPDTLDRNRAYQTVFARVDGSIAAPTASLHFTEKLLGDIADRGIGIAKLVLEVGLGTFAPVRTESLRDHEMHEERFTIPAETTEAIAQTRARGGRVIAVGTTVVRALESQADENGAVAFGAGTTRIFIGPGYRFRTIDALITNFHVPRSTLLALVSAFSGRERILAAYKHAVNERYRLFSFGDAMFLEPALSE